MAFETWYQISLKFYFSQYREFLEFNESHLREVIDKFEKENQIDEDLEETDPDYYYFFVDDVAEKWHMISRDFPSEFRTSFLSQVYNGVDSHLNKVCNRYQKIHVFSEDWKDMKGSEWARKAKYLKKHGHVDFTDIQDEWDFLENIRQIRNLIVHHHSSICANDKDWVTVKKFIAENPDLIKFKNDINEIVDNGEPLYKSRPNHNFEILIHTPELNRLLLLTAESFFKKLLPHLSFLKPV